MLVRSVQDPTSPALIKAALQYSGGAVSRAAQAATVLNAVVVFTSFFGLLGVGIVLNAAETLLRLGSGMDSGLA